MMGKLTMKENLHQTGSLNSLLIASYEQAY